MSDEHTTRTCPYCKEAIKADAIRCKHYRSAVAPASPPHGGTCPYCKEVIHPDALKCKHCAAWVGPAPLQDGALWSAESLDNPRPTAVINELEASTSAPLRPEGMAVAHAKQTGKGCGPA